jgi:hypothetical protein
MDRAQVDVPVMRRLRVNVTHGVGRGSAQRGGVSGAGICGRQSRRAGNAGECEDRDAGGEADPSAHGGLI